MRSLFTLAALAGAVLGARHFFMFMKEKEKKRLEETKLEVWEGEGGAVPVGPARSAAQVRPEKHPVASPHGVS